jgi:hypothetical protein
LQKCVPWAGQPVLLSDPDVRVADMNGDGLPAKKGDDVVRIQTVDTRARGVIPTPREMRAAGRILKAYRQDALILVPKD